jgi:hypothetical protein
MKRIIFCVMIALLCGCKREKSVEMGPAETVEEFSKAVAACQWDKAMELCDTVKMQDYINAYRNAVSKMEKEDEGAMKVAKTLLESTAVTVEDVHKHDDKRIVTYTIETDGLKKTRQATLRKEEGAWRVEAITEAD